MFCQCSGSCKWCIVRDGPWIPRDWVWMHLRAGVQELKESGWKILWGRVGLGKPCGLWENERHLWFGFSKAKGLFTPTFSYHSLLSFQTCLFPVLQVVWGTFVCISHDLSSILKSGWFPCLSWKPSRRANRGSHVSQRGLCGLPVVSEDNKVWPSVY